MLGCFLAAALAACSSVVPEFVAARPVWRKGGERTMNDQLVFAGAFTVKKAETGLLLKVAAPNPFRVKVDGEFVWYGPARGPKGFFRVDEIPVAASEGRHELEIEVSGNYCRNFYFQRQPSFLAAELARGREVLLATGEPSARTFRARASQRVRRVSRYSHARAFGEAYAFGAPAEPVELALQPEVAYLPRIVPAPDFSLADDFRLETTAPVTYDAAKETRKIGFVESAGTPSVDGYPKAELAYDLWDLQQRLSGGSFYVAPVDRTGFPRLRFTCREPGELVLTFDEYPVAGDFKPGRSVVANAIVLKAERPGTYDFEAMEPYVFRAVNVAARSGRFVWGRPAMRLYRNAASRAARYSGSDAALGRIFRAAEENYAQNAVDGFLDCPGRERANWNCDAYFTARSAWFLTRDNRQETLFFDNFARPKDFDNVDAGMLPMCYPSDFQNGNYIPSWAMFFVLQLEEYARLRQGDPAVIAALKPRVLELVAFLSKYRNADGLLEKLPRWVFVEWSKANDFVQDVNYPNNMLWVAALEAVDRLYGRTDLAAEAARMRETIRRQSWDGAFFRDHAVRNAQGALEVRPDRSETCQYYAFYFGTATKELYPALFRKLTTEFGPERVKRGLYPDVHPSAPFIGNFMRLDWLRREGFTQRMQGELVGYFGYMAEATGTIWENADSANNGSCCHGFASYAALLASPER